MTRPPNSSAPRPIRPAPVPRNGVDLPNLLATINAVRDRPVLAAFEFRATNQWVKGAHSRTRLESFSGAGGEHTHARDFCYDADYPAVLCGDDEGPAPVEFLLHGLASCLTAGVASIAAASGVNLTEVESTLEGAIDLRGILGLADEVRTGYQRVTCRFKIRGDAPAEVLREIVSQSRRRSAVFDVISNATPIELEIDAG